MSTALSAVGAGFKVQGQTSAGAAIATVDIQVWGDGSVRFTIGGVPYRIYPTGPEALLFQTILAGGTGPGVTWRV